MEYEELKKQWNDRIFREMVRNACGSVCYNCGCTENVQYHHIVPLKLGGTNNLSNIAVLCSRCHKAAHRGQHISHYINTENMGRPRSAPDYIIEQALDDYCSGQIGSKECARRAGISTYKVHLSERIWFKEYKKKHHIKRIENRIDIKLCRKNGGDKRKLRKGEEVGYVEYENGEIKTLYYHGAD